MKKLVMFLSGLVALSSLSACSNAEEAQQTATAESLATATIQVTSIEGNTIVAEVGEIEEQEMSMPEGMGPDKPGEEGMGEQSHEKPEGEPMEKPEGEAEGEPMEKPEGEEPGQGAPGGTAPSVNVFVSNGETLTLTCLEDTEITVEFLQGKSEGSIEDIHVGSVLDCVYDTNMEASTIVVRNLNAGMGFGGSDTVENGTSALTIEEDSEKTGVQYTSNGDDENAVRVDGATVSLTDCTIEKTGGSSSNTENGDFYGANAGLLALNGATVSIEGGTFETNAVNGNAIFSYGEGTLVQVSNAKIHTTMRNSGGIQTTGGATMQAENLDVETDGDSSAAIRSDRGGGTVTVQGGSYVTNGTGSPAIYSTANITVNSAVLTAHASEGVVVEGKNSVTLNDCTLMGSMQSVDPEENVHGVMIYQSMSGDADLGEASFSAKGGSISTSVGDLFYVTNTDCVLSLENVELALAEGNLLTVAGNNSSRGWGTAGANGADVVFNCTNQTCSGKISVDQISSLTMTMENSAFTGSINSDEEGGSVTLTMDDASTWTLTADSAVSQFDGNLDQVETNGFHLYVNGECVK